MLIIPTLATHLTDTLNQLNWKREHRGEVHGISTGFSPLDEAIEKLHESELIILGGRPAMGKTAFALSLARQSAAKNQLPVLFFCHRRSAHELTNRLLAAECDINLLQFRQGVPNPAEREKLQVAIERMKSLSFFIDDNPHTLETINMRVQKIREEMGKIGLIVLHEIESIIPYEQRHDGSLGKTLKALASSSRAPVLYTSDLAQMVDERADHRPTLADIRDQSLVEQADHVWFLYRSGFYKQELSSTDAQIFIEKAPRLHTGEVPLRFVARYSRYEVKE